MTSSYRNVLGDCPRMQDIHRSCLPFSLMVAKSPYFSALPAARSRGGRGCCAVIGERTGDTQPSGTNQRLEKKTIACPFPSPVESEALHNAPSHP